MTELLDTQSSARKFAFFLLGVTVPIASYYIWANTVGKPVRKEQIDQAHDITLEDSFPASDPPSAW